MKTEYFGKMKSYPKNNGYKFVSIARFNKFWTGEEYKKLTPPAEIIKIEDIEKSILIIAKIRRKLYVQD